MKKTAMPRLFVRGRISFISIMCMIFSFGTRADSTNMDDLVVTIAKGTYTYYEVFKLIEKQVNLRFIYCHTAVDDTRRITTGFDRQPLKIVLGSLFGKKIDFRIRGKAIILSPTTDMDNRKTMQKNSV